MKNEKIETNAENNKNQQNSNSEVKPRSKKLTIVLISLIIVLILAMGVCAGIWIAGDTTKIINNKEELVKEEEKNTSKKIDETKPWVYDADYNKEIKTIYETSDKSYFRNSNECLKVPYININSEDAKKVNEEIEKLYEECYLGFGKLLDEQSDWKTYQIYDATYNFYENENILSVVLQLSNGVVVVNGGAGGGNSTIYTYNFDLETLKLATLDEMASICGFNSGSDVTNKITTWENNQYNFVKKYPGGVVASFEGVSKGKYFIDSNGKLNFVYKYSAASSGDVSQVIEPDMEIEDFYDMNNADEPQVQKSIFDQANSLKFTSNLTDDINGKIALLKMGENQFKTEIKDGYYMYNAWNDYGPDWHYIKEIKSITSEFCDLNNYKTSALFKCTMKYIDNNNQEKSVELAVIVDKNFNGSLWGNFGNYSGSTMFTRQFMDAYYDIATEQEVTEIQEFLNKGENNGFVQINYDEDNASGLKLKSILNAMPDGGESLMNTYLTEQELKEVGVSSEQLHKYDVSKLNGFFYKKIGLTLDRIKNLNTDGMTYSEKYNSYYTNFGDTSYSEVKVTECGKDYYGGIYYVQGECGERKFETELLKTDEGYKFRYNIVK